MELVPPTTLGFFIRRKNMLFITHNDIEQIAFGDPRENFTFRYKEGILLYTEIIELKDLNLTEKVVLACFVDDSLIYGDELNYSNKDIAEYLSINESEVVEAIEKLHTLGYINIKKRSKKSWGRILILFKIKK